MGCLQIFYSNRKKENSESQLVNHQTQNSQYLEDFQKQQALNFKTEKTNNNDKVNQNQQSLEGNSIKYWNKDCSKFLYDLCKIISDNYDKLLLYKNIQFYYREIGIQKKLKQKNDGNLYEIKGFIYLTQYDKHYNPKFKLQSGIFLVNLKRREFKLVGEGVEYQGKSELIKYKGTFENGEFKTDIKKTINNQNQNKVSKRNNQKIIIIDVETGKQTNLQNQIRKQQDQIQDVWCKYNQQISNNDLNILEKKRWMTSSIIDSYVLNLNLKSETEYFQLEELKRKQIKRILFLPSSLTTNFGVNFDKQKAKDLLKQELLEYSQMDLAITNIYQRIGFPINKNNFHWYFLLFDAETEIVQIFDSTLNSNDYFIHDKKLIDTLAECLKIKIRDKQTHKASGQQRNGYSCGHHVCNFMKFCQEIQFSQKDYQYNEDEIIDILKQTIAKN